MKALFTLLILIATSAHAADTLDLRALMHSSDSQQMKQRLARSHEVPRLRALCTAQLRKKYVPTACFEALALDSHPRAPESWLVDNCVHAATALTDLGLVHRLAKSPALPDRCRAEIQSRDADLRYAAETEKPDALFEATANVR
jgi:hypothetical protein